MRLLCRLGDLFFGPVCHFHMLHQSCHFQSLYRMGFYCVNTAHLLWTTILPQSFYNNTYPLTLFTHCTTTHPIVKLQISEMHSLSLLSHHCVQHPVTLPTMLLLKIVHSTCAFIYITLTPTTCNCPFCHKIILQLLSIFLFYESTQPCAFPLIS